jgi:hypothetical protein
LQGIVDDDDDDDDNDDFAVDASAVVPLERRKRKKGLKMKSREQYARSSGACVVGCGVSKSGEEEGCSLQ